MLCETSLRVSSCVVVRKREKGEKAAPQRPPLFAFLTKSTVAIPRRLHSLEPLDILQHLFLPNTSPTLVQMAPVLSHSNLRTEHLFILLLRTL